MLKNLPDEGIMLLTSFIQQFWDDDCNFEQWHKTKLSMLYKGKGNMQDPNNWCGICLKETSAKIVSAIITNRLVKNLEATKANVNNSDTLAVKRHSTLCDLHSY